MLSRTLPICTCAGLRCVRSRAVEGSFTPPIYTHVQAFDAYVAELSKDPLGDPGSGETRGLATVGGERPELGQSYFDTDVSLLF